MAGSAITAFRATVTGADTDTVKEITKADADSSFLENLTFNKGETLYLSVANNGDVTTSSSEFHVTVVMKFNVNFDV